MKPLARPASWMAVMSGVSFGLNLGITAVGHEWLGLSEELAFFLSIATLMVINFLAYRYLIFEDSEGSVAEQAIRFLATAIGFRSAEYLTFLAVHTWLGVHYLLAVTGVLGFSFVAKFLFFGRFVFRSPLLTRGSSTNPGTSEPLE